MLEDALLAFSGSVLIVSHDRYFLSQVANTIFQFGDKTVVRHDSDYHDFIDSISDSANVKDKIVSRYVEGDNYQITKAKIVSEEGDERKSKSKNFGGSGIFSGNYKKGVKNAKRFVE